MSLFICDGYHDLAIKMSQTHSFFISELAKKKKKILRRCNFYKPYSIGTILKFRNQLDEFTATIQPPLVY